MTDDLVKRLHKAVSQFYGTHPCGLLAEAAVRIEELKATLSHYACGCKEDKCTPEKPRYRDLKCGWPARQALEGKNEQTP
jgi:hypothetical protein